MAAKEAEAEAASVRTGGKGLDGSAAPASSPPRRVLRSRKNGVPCRPDSPGLGPVTSFARAMRQSAKLTPQLASPKVWQTARRAEVWPRWELSHVTRGGQAHSLSGARRRFLVPSLRLPLARYRHSRQQ
eukprot:scaffold306343_cov17-Tisochrysis_lutea.AAC.1